MVGVCLFGTITSVCKANASGTTFYLELEDTTGVVLMKLIFIGPWYHFLYLSDVLFVFFPSILLSSIVCRDNLLRLILQDNHDFFCNG